MCKALEDMKEKAKEIGKAQAIVDVLEMHGEVPESIKCKILEQKDMDELTRLLRIAAQVRSIDEFVEKI